MNQRLIPKRLMSMVSRLHQLVLGLLLCLCLLAHPSPTSAAASPNPLPVGIGSSTVDAAIEQYLASMPDDYHAIRSVAALKQFLRSADALLIDVRSTAEYNTGHIPGAVNIPLTVLGLHVADIPVDQPVVLYCSSGYRSAMGVMALQLEGRHRASGFPPSLQGWSAAGETLVTS